MPRAPDFRWLLALGAMLVTALSAMLAVLGLYFYRFHGQLSTNASEWNNFGSFVGGTLGPAFSFFSFVALIVTLHLQRVESRLSKQALEASAAALQQTREIAAAEAERLKAELLRADLFRVIEVVHKELEQIMLRRTDFSPAGDTMGNYFSESARSKDAHHIPNNGDMLSATDRTNILDLFERVGELDSCLNQYETFFGRSALTYYFRRRYMTARRKLVQHRYAEDFMWEGFKSPGYGWSGPPKHG